MIKRSNGKYVISAGEFSSYTVCPYSWKLKSILNKKYRTNRNHKVEKGRDLHSDWCKKTEDIHVLKTKKVLVLGMLCFVFLFAVFFLKSNFDKSVSTRIVVLKEKSASFAMSFFESTRQLLNEVILVDFEFGMIAILTCITLFVVYFTSLYIRKRAHLSGIKNDSKFLSIDGSVVIPGENYISHIQGLSGKPDALIKENGFFIPVEIKPLAKKLKDRYIYQLLVYMRLVSEFKKKDVPYGYLILGPKSKRVKIYNLPERQKMLTKFLEEMQEVLENKREALPSPTVPKCTKCDVAKYCKFSVGNIQE